MSMMTPWDLDLTFGNYWVDDLDENNTIRYFLTSDINMPFQHGYLGQILQNNDTDLADTIKKYYWELREGPWSDEHINQLIDLYEKDIYGSGAFVRDRERWPLSTANKPEQGLSVFRQYVLERLQACDLYYSLPYLEGTMGRDHGDGSVGPWATGTMVQRDGAPWGRWSRGTVLLVPGPKLQVRKLVRSADIPGSPYAPLL